MTSHDSPEDDNNRARPRRSAQKDQKSSEGKNSIAAKEQFRVVIVDDEEALLKLYTSALSRSGCSVLGAFTEGKKAVDYFANNHVIWPEIALIDYRMPNMNGLETAKALKAMNPKLRTVLVSALELTPEALPYFDRAIQKPFSISKLLEIIRSVSRDL